MKVGFNARVLSGPHLRGWSRYTVNLLRQLNKSGVDLILYSDQTLNSELIDSIEAPAITIKIKSGLKYSFWEQIWLRNEIKADSLDIFHCPINFGLPLFANCPKVLTLHDAIGQAYYEPKLTFRQKLSRARILSRLYEAIAVRAADQIITVSQHAAQDINKHYRVPREKISTIYEAADPQFYQSVPTQSSFQSKNPYFIYIGGWEDRKNIPFLVESFAQAELGEVDLVLGGGKSKEKLEIAAISERLGISKKVHLLEWIPDIELPALIKQAIAFVYPSLYEGFGLQLVESMAVGTPVLVSNRSSLPEIAGPAAATFDPTLPQELSNLLKKITNDDNYRLQLAEAAKKQGKMFSWEQTAQKTIEVYEELLKSS